MRHDENFDSFSGFWLKTVYSKDKTMYSMILKFALRHSCGEGKMETSVKVETKGLVSFWMVHYMSLRYMTARGLC